MEWAIFLDFPKNYQINSIICGDFNGHSNAWESELEGNEDKWLLECILNNGSPTKIYNHGKKRVVQI